MPIMTKFAPIVCVLSMLLIRSLAMAGTGADLVWRNRDTGASYGWTMNGARLAPGGDRFFGTVPPNWDLAASGDFDGDGDPDLIWRNRDTGATYFWLMNGWTTRPDGVRLLGNVPPFWALACAGDFDGDGRTDLVWRNRDTGATYFWLMDGLNLVAGGDRLLTTTPANWEIGGCGDFDGDGHVDLVWRNQDTGAVYIWLMDGTAMLPDGDVFLGVVPTNWFISGAGDFNGDGNADLVWRNRDTGATYFWLMDGVRMMPGGDLFLGNFPPNWETSVIPPSRPRWVLRRTRTAPSRRNVYAMAAMPGKTVLYGGLDQSGEGRSDAMDDTWEWDGSTWRQLFPRTSPGKREGARMVYDEANDRLLMFGGADGNNPGARVYDDLWAWNGEDWTEISTAHRPQGRVPYGLAYDSARRKVVLYGGFTLPAPLVSLQVGDTWEFDGQDWLERHPATTPGVIQQTSMTYDPLRRQVVLAGGLSYDDGVFPRTPDTWLWDGNDWTRLTPSVCPPNLNTPAMTFHAGLGEVLLFGGIDGFGTGQPSNDTWLWNGTRWNKTSPSRASTAAHNGLAYDPDRDRAVRFEVSRRFRGMDTWELVTPRGRRISR
jgi:hypothetical protein